jgi:hypothetical protein
MHISRGDSSTLMEKLQGSHGSMAASGGVVYAVRADRAVRRHRSCGAAVTDFEVTAGAIRAEAEAYGVRCKVQRPFARRVGLA